MSIERTNYMWRVSLIGLAFFISTSLFAQDLKIYPAKNDAGKYGMLSRNIETNEKDTVAPFIYREIMTIGDRFLLLDRKMTKFDERGVLERVYFSGDVVDQEMKLVRHFDSIDFFPLDTDRFVFFEKGKMGYYSANFVDKKWTILYDEMNRSMADIRIPWIGYAQPTCIARLGESYVLIGPLGNILAKLHEKDEVRSWNRDLLKIDRFESKKSEIIDRDGEIIISDVVDYTSSYDNKTKIITHSNGFQSLWNEGECLLAAVPYDFSKSIAHGTRFFAAKDADDLSYILDSLGAIHSGPFEDLIKLDYENHYLIKEDGFWRLEGNKFKEFTDKRYPDLEIKEESRRTQCYFLKEGETKLAILAQGEFIRLGETDAGVSFVDDEVLAKKDEKWGYLAANGFSDFIFDEIEWVAQYSDFLFARLGKFKVLLKVDGTVLFEDLKLTKLEYHDCEVGQTFELKNKTGTGYFDIYSDAEKVNMIYDDFECGDYGLCLKKDGKWGLVGADGEILEEFKHKKLKEVQSLGFY